MNITAEQLSTGTGCTMAMAVNWLSSIQAAMDKFEINTPKRISAFLANVGVESAGFSALTENCNYSANGLAKTWPNRYAVDQHALVKVPNDLANRIANNPQAIANNCYANRMGNGDEASGDGWKFRGQGPIQVTGKTAIANCGNAIGVDLTSDPTQLQQPPYGALSAAWFFATSGCNQSADAGDIAGVIRHINGQPPCTVNEGALRISRYNSALASFPA
jgi:putative chitinase